MPNIETITTKGIVYNVVDTGARDTLNNLSEVARTGSFNNLADLPTVNGQVLRGDVVITADTISYNDLTDLPVVNGSELKGNYNFATLVNGKVPLEQLPEMGGGATYTEGEGITISDTNEISVDFDTVARKSDIPTVDYPVTSVNGETGAIDISNIIMPGGAIRIDKSGNQRVISIKFQDQDGFMSTGLTGGLALDFEVVAKKEYVDGLIGDINTILDEINGEEV